MQILQIISEHKKTRQNLNQKGRFHSQRGWSEYTYEINGEVKTAHGPVSASAIKTGNPQN